MALRHMYITNNPDVALIAQKYGVERVWVDLETIGKEERQRGRDTVKSHHRIEDIKIIAPLLSTSEMLVRINSWNASTRQEIEDVINAGADIIMLPYWKTVNEVKDFLDIIHGRCKNILLLETKEAVECLEEVLKLPGIDEIHIGLNDLHLSYGMTFLFEPLANGLIDKIGQKIRDKGIPFGFGGIAKIGDGAIPAEKIILEHFRLKSTGAILSRTFCDNATNNGIDEIERVFRENMKKIRSFEEYAEKVPEDVYEKNRLDLIKCVNEVVMRMKEKK